MIALVIILSMFPMVASAANGKTEVPGNVYDLKKDSHYVLGENSPSASATIGTLSIGGNVKVSSEVNSFPAYEVTNGNATFSYAIKPEVLTRNETEWHLIDDKSKKVNDLNLDTNILSGALILQTSLDGITWTEDVMMSDIFGNEADTDVFYETKDVQLQNGCYYRVLAVIDTVLVRKDGSLAFRFKNGMEIEG